MGACEPNQGKRVSDSVLGSIIGVFGFLRNQLELEPGGGSIMG